MLNKFVKSNIGDLKAWEFLLIIGIWTLVIGLLLLLVAKGLKLFDVDDGVINFIQKLGRVAFARTPNDIFKENFEHRVENFENPQAIEENSNEIGSPWNNK